MAIGSEVLRSRPPSRPRMTAAEPAADDQGRSGPLLDAIEAGQIALEKIRQAVVSSPDGFRHDDGISQQGLGLGMIQERHRVSSPECAYPPLS